MSKKTFLLFQVLLLSFLPFSLSAQQSPKINVQIEGVIIDTLTEETIPYATIKVYDKSKPDEIDKVVPTDDKGKFRFSMNRKGDYTMTVEFIGKQKLIREFTVGDERKIDMGNLAMSDDSKLLGEVVVSAQKPLVKVDIDKITYSMEDDPESKTNNVLEMLKKVPMVTVDGEDKIELKGSSSFKIYLNGKPSNMISNNPKDVLKSMPANTVKDIEVITDPGAKYDAEGVAGIINIITQKNSSMAGYNARVNAGADQRGGYNFGGNLTFKAGKFGFMGNYNLYKYKQPDGISHSYSRNIADPERMYIHQDGSSNNNGTGQYGSGEISYEIDTLNLINVGFNRYYGKGKNNSWTDVSVRNSEDIPVEEYKRFGYGENTYGYTGVNVDYQRTFANSKDRLLTFSYRYGTSPDDWSSDSDIEPILNYNDKHIRQHSDGKMNEHTFQIDFTTPIAKIHTVEAGAKYILRENKSNSGYRHTDAGGVWKDSITNNDRFNHQQNILSAYLGYSARVKKFGFKAGLRYEATDVEGKYPLSSKDNFEADYSNLVPSATVSYQLSPMQNLRLGYNMRIWRPSIWNLNPFPNSTDPLYVSFGNPELEAVKSHAINMNYSYFNPKFNFNANMSYDFTNNNIESYQFFDEGVYYTTYYNIGKSRRLNLFTYVNWTPSTKLRITSNMSGSYTDVRANNDKNDKNSGFTGRLHLNATYTLPLLIKLGGYGGYSSPYIGLQNKGSSFRYYGFSLSKDFMNDKLNVRLSASNPFTATRTFKNEIETPEFYRINESVVKMRHFSVNVSFSFGEMKSQIKKARRSISNDDTSGGGGGSGGQGGGQTPQ